MPLGVKVQFPRILALHDKGFYGRNSMASKNLRI